MIEAGKVQELTIDREKPFGVYLTDPEDGDISVLLPRAQVPEGAAPGDKVEVFVYRDSEDRLIATVKRPYITLGEIRRLKLIGITSVGGFLDWGLEKDLFMPYKEMKGKPSEGDMCTVKLYTDRSGRLCATMRISKTLTSDHGYKKGDAVKGTVYRINRDLGVFVAVDDSFDGMIPISEYSGGLKEGDPVEARVVKVRDDGKLQLTMKERIDIQMDVDCARIMELFDDAGELPVTEADDPETIRRVTGMSKAAFKRAVGRLLKNRTIIITDKIKLNKQ
ncbi:MAG: S1 RNA-binding domain-containing protein [Lachnospiraceae bacterium]|nr:S1 RNA-binding domain-containing protein [Lachnospiraceae bacterium]